MMAYFCSCFSTKIEATEMRGCGKRGGSGQFHEIANKDCKVHHAHTHMLQVHS